jgi:hypothetical protein
MENSNDVQQPTNVGNEVLADVINCTTCWWNEKREEQAPCAYCGSSYGEFNQHLPTSSIVL